MNLATQRTIYGLSSLHLAFYCTDLSLTAQDLGLVEVPIQASFTERERETQCRPAEAGTGNAISPHWDSPSF